MAVGMAGPDEKAGLMKGGIVLTVLVASCLAAAMPAVAQAPATLAPLPNECAAPGGGAIVESPLPNVAIALRDRKKIRILAIGGTSASLRGPVSGGHYAVVERFLEQTFTGLDVEVVHRGVSGELAADAAERIKTEVALTSADLVLWQLGTADALARVPLDDFRNAVNTGLNWLKEHNIDVIMVGMRYARSMAADPDYQATRREVQAIAKSRNVLRIGRYESEEVLERVRKNQGVVLADAEITEAGYACLAEYIARAIAAGLFVKPARPGGVLPAPGLKQ